MFSTDISYWFCSFIFFLNFVCLLYIWVHVHIILIVYFPIHSKLIVADLPQLKFTMQSYLKCLGQSIIWPALGLQNRKHMLNLLRCLHYDMLCLSNMPWLAQWIKPSIALDYNLVNYMFAQMSIREIKKF